MLKIYYDIVLINKCKEDNIFHESNISLDCIKVIFKLIIPMTVIKENFIRDVKKFSLGENLENSLIFLPYICNCALGTVYPAGRK